jgi:hypothetical protein
LLLQAKTTFSRRFYGGSAEPLLVGLRKPNGRVRLEKAEFNGQYHGRKNRATKNDVAGFFVFSVQSSV